MSQPNQKLDQVLSLNQTKSQWVPKKLTLQQQYRKTEVLNKFIEFCHDFLPFDKEVIVYLKGKRKIAEKTLNDFKIGVFPSNIHHLLKHFTMDDLSLAGIAYLKDSRPFSKFTTNKLIIPIYDVYGKALGIMGRVMCNEEKRNELGVAKYINTQYPKTSTLYGLNIAKEYILNAGEVIVVEGNFDVISAYQAGIKNVVATNGAFLSRKQIYKLCRYAHIIKIAMDNDEAGQKAIKTILKRQSTDPIPSIKIERYEIPIQFKDLDEWMLSKI